ncbi:MAG: hypothetical protein MZV64_52855 [Ignavibacteriales bacterium]|nr:hypothetical protein [Ignavibacteriales bacterium]
MAAPATIRRRSSRRTRQSSHAARCRSRRALLRTASSPSIERLMYSWALRHLIVVLP